MEYARILALIAIGSHASPILDGRKTLDTSLSPYNGRLETTQLDGELHSLEKRIDVQKCKKIGKTGNPYSCKGIDLAREICDGEEHCEKITDWVKDGMDILFLIVGYAQRGAINSGDGGTEQRTEQGAVRRYIDPDVDFGKLMDDRLRSHGLTYDQFESVDVSDWPLEKRGPGPHLSHRYIMHRYKDSRSDELSDVTLDYYDDDGYNLQIAASDNDTEANLAKRYDGQGVKIAWTTRDGDPFATMDDGEVYQFSQAVARDFHDRGIRDGVSQYFGLVKTGHKANAYFRIIGQTRGFGDNYESVNACGQMTGFL